MHTALPTPGDHVWIRQRRWRVERIRCQNDVVRYDVLTRDRHASFLAPFDRPVWTNRAGRLRYAAPRQARARLADLFGRAFADRTLASLVAADADVLAHQLEPAFAVINGARRVLIADEVGLGKTIQASLIIAEILRREPASRVLVVVPASLAEQWIDELRRRFLITCLHADRSGLDAGSRTGALGDNPWSRSGVWIASLDYLKQPHVLGALPLSPWDLVVVDEAHIACGDSDRHGACRAVTSRARRVVLLTATPHDGDATRFARLVELGALPEIADPLTIFRRTRFHVRARGARRVRWHRVRLSPEESRLFEALDNYQQAVLGAAGTDRRDGALLLLSVFRKRGLSTMRALAVSLRRRLAWLEHGHADGETEPVQGTLAFAEVDELAPDETHGLTADVGLDCRQERAWIRRLVVLADAAGLRDSKAARVVALARRVREPVIVFTEFRDSLEVLRQRFGAEGLVACLHGGQSSAERRTELARFLAGTSSVLIATDVASLGLNLQSRARAIINLELPWNPVRLEQRAGRVDRIGQASAVHVTLIVAKHAAEAPVVIRLAQRTLTARRAIADELIDEHVIGEAAVRASVLAGASVSVPTPSAPLWSLSQRWVRTARAAARGLARRRALRCCWRAPDEDGRGGRWTFAARLPAVRGVKGSTTLFFSVPLIDGCGTVVESHPVAVRVTPQSPTHRWSARAIEPAARVAAHAVAPRARRLSRRLRTRGNLDAARERTIGAHLSALRRPAEAQPGLFNQRERRAFEANRRDAQAVHAAVEQRISDVLRRCVIEVGQPTLVLALIDEP